MAVSEKPATLLFRAGTDIAKILVSRNATRRQARFFLWERLTSGDFDDLYGACGRGSGVVGPLRLGSQPSAHEKEENCFLLVTTKAEFPHFVAARAKMDLADLKYEIDSILRPEPDEEGHLRWDPPHPRLSSVHGLDTSYFLGPFEPNGDGAFERLLEGDSDPLHQTLQSISVPFSLLTAALQLFGDSLIEYHKRQQRWDLYRFYPPILMTVWSAFEAWVRMSSEIFVAVVPTLPRAVRDALLEVRSVVLPNGKIKEKSDRRPVLERYWLLLKYGCNLEYPRGNWIWQAGERVATLRDSLVHYDVSIAPSLTASEIWNQMEAVMLLFIAPSTQAQRTLFPHQFDFYCTLAQLHPLISEFEERPLHKGWPKHAKIFHCPFDGVDETKYPHRYK
jgi:hypothetical protein